MNTKDSTSLEPEDDENIGMGETRLSFDLVFRFALTQATRFLADLLT